MKIIHGWWSRYNNRQPTHHGQPDKGTHTVSVVVSDEGLKELTKFLHSLEEAQGTRCKHCHKLTGAGHKPCRTAEEIATAADIELKKQGL